MNSVLVVDDEIMVLKLVQKALSNENFSVETAGAGDEAIRKFNEGEFDLVITDICMPGADGNKVVRHIKNSTRRTTPVVGISGTPWLLRSDEFDSVLQKPFSIKSLIDTVKALTELPAVVPSM